MLGWGVVWRRTSETSSAGKATKLEKGVGRSEQTELSEGLSRVLTTAREKLSQLGGELGEEFLYFERDAGGAEVLRRSSESPIRPSRLKAPQEAVVKIQSYCADLSVDTELLNILAAGKTAQVVQANLGIFGDLGESSEFETDEFEKGMCVVLVRRSREGRIAVPRKGRREGSIPVWEIPCILGVEVFAGYLPESASKVILTRIDPGTREEKYFGLMRENWRINSKEQSF